MRRSSCRRAIGSCSCIRRMTRRFRLEVGTRVFFDIEMKIPDLIHCVYKNESNQIVIPRMDERVYDYHDYYR